MTRCPPKGATVTMTPTEARQHLRYGLVNAQVFKALLHAAKTLGAKK
jgi:hypothetical protein